MFQRINSSVLVSKATSAVWSSVPSHLPRNGAPQRHPGPVVAFESILDAITFEHWRDLCDTMSGHNTGTSGPAQAVEGTDGGQTKEQLWDPEFLEVVVGHVNAPLGVCDASQY